MNNDKMYVHSQSMKDLNRKLKEAYDKMKHAFARYRLKVRVYEFEEEFDSDEWKCYMDSVGYDWSIYD